MDAKVTHQCPYTSRFSSAIGKESTKALRSFRAFDGGINSMRSDGCAVIVSEKEVALKVTITSHDGHEGY